MAEKLALDGIRGTWFNVLANRWFQPLTHVSARGLPRDRRDSCQRRKRGTREEHRFVSQHRVLQSVRPMFSTIRAGKRLASPPAHHSEKGLRNG